VSPQAILCTPGVRFYFEAPPAPAGGTGITVTIMMLLQRSVTLGYRYILQITP